MNLTVAQMQREHCGLCEAGCTLWKGKGPCSWPEVAPFSPGEDPARCVQDLEELRSFLGRKQAGTAGGGLPTPTRRRSGGEILTPRRAR